MPASRHPDVVVVGTTFLDVTLAGLSDAPRPGREVFASRAAHGPGGVATSAVAAARVGARTALASPLGDDLPGRWCRELLESAGVDLSAAPTIPDWPTPLTVSIAHGGDRALVTHEIPRAPAEAPRGTVLLTDLPALELIGTRREWGLVVAGTGWDATGGWDHARLRTLENCDVFVLNAVEAMGYARTDDPVAAARALGSFVPLTVVTLGPDGVVVSDAATGTLSRVPAVAVTAIDPTGAGDVFAGTLAGRLALGDETAHAVTASVLCAGLSTTRVGSALSAPTWAEAEQWRSDAAR